MINKATANYIAINLKAYARGRKDALEEAAKVADSHMPMGYMSDRERSYCTDHGTEIAQAIRDLSGEYDIAAGDGKGL